jgi:hypothetical protein
MLTFFSTAKPFTGHSRVVQRNALNSWKLLHPDVEIILFGDEEGAAEVCEELSLRHETYLERNESGLKRIDHLFDRAQEIARHDVLCYVNCDIILTQDFLAALTRVREREKRFLMVGRRWDLDVTTPLDFANPQWAEAIQKRARASGRQRPAQWIDYFAFSKGLYLHQIPAFVIGRVNWDNWLIWFADAVGARVIDASKAITAVHQNHDYSYHPKGKDGVWSDAQSKRNFELAGGHKHLRTIATAKFRLTPSGLVPNRRHRLNHYLAVVSRHGILLSSRALSLWQSYVWHPFLNSTRRFRQALGLRRS